MGEPDPLRRPAAFVLDQGHGHPFGDGVKQRHRELRAFSGARAGDQRFEYRLIGGEPGGDIDDGHPDAGGRLRSAGDGDEPGIGLDQKVIGLALRIGAVFAIAGNRTDHEARMVMAQPRERKAELLDRARLQILHEDVGPCEHRREQRFVFGGSEVENDGLFAAVEPGEIGALAMREIVIPAREIALRPLDLDHARAGVGKPTGAQGRSHRLFDRNDEQPGKRKRHERPCPTGSAWDQVICPSAMTSTPTG